MISLALPPQMWLRHANGALETRVARAWNRYGNLLLRVAGRLGIDVALAVAVVAAEDDPRGLAADNRLVLRFEPHIFFERWGRQHPDRFAQHFQFDPARPWQGHRWRAAADADWREVHGSLADEWAAFTLARSLGDAAACEAAALGFAAILGASHPDGGSRQVDALRAGDLETYATLAAGPGQAARLAGALRAAAQAFQRLNAG